MAKEFDLEKRDTSNENRGRGQPFLWLIFIAICIFLLIRHLGITMLWSVLVTLAGFSLVIIFHEFGHFIAAKLTGMKVEAFSIGYPPTLLGIKRTGEGYRIRILPAFFRKRKEAPDGQADEDGLCFTIGRAAKLGETEFRIGLILFGGYVKILGQEDIGRVKTTDDSRSYANKPVWKRMLAIAAGVTFNAILAAILFIVVFNVGIKLLPAVVGGVELGSPAQLAGLRGGDEVIEIAGRRYNLDFSDIATAAALSGKEQKIPVTVRHEDGSVESFRLIAQIDEDSEEKLKRFGIMMPFSLKVDQFENEDAFYEATGLKPGDRIVAVNGREVKTHWQLEEIISNTYEPAVTLTAERIVRVKQEDGTFSEKTELVKSSKIRLIFFAEGQKSTIESGIYSLVPRLRVADVTELVTGPVRKGDIIVAAAGVKDPNYSRFRKVIEEYELKELPLTVLRKEVNEPEKLVTITAQPRRLNDKVIIGVVLEPDFNSPVIAETAVDKNGKKLFDIPSGARIISVGRVKVSSFYDFAEEMKKNIGKDTQITWQLDGRTKGKAEIMADQWSSLPYVTPQIPFNFFKPMERLYKADGLADAIKMGLKRTNVYIQQAYLTVKRLLEGQVSPKSLSGPVGIFSISYQIVTKRPLVDYLFLIALISAFIGVLNALPLLPFDGGHIVFLLIEKIKGSPVSEKIQYSFAAAGWVLVGMLAIYVTFNDVIKTIKLFS
jgi:regulator of sigma E protease